MAQLLTVITDNTKNVCKINEWANSVRIPFNTMICCYSSQCRCFHWAAAWEAAERLRWSQWRQGVLTRSQALTHQATLLGSEAVVLCVGALIPCITPREAGQSFICSQHWCRIRARITVVTISHNCTVCLSSAQTYLWLTEFQSAFQHRVTL